jgi:hypothetical protein
MRPVERDNKRIYSRLCLRIEHLEQIYRLVVAAKHRFDFEYGDDVIEGIEDFDKLREMRKPARYIRVFSEQIVLAIMPLRAELEVRNRTLTEGTAKLLLEIDQILRNQQTFWSGAKLANLWRLIMVLVGLVGGFVVTNPHGVRQIFAAIALLIVVILFYLFNKLMLRRVKIKWDRQLHFAPILQTVISSVIAGVIVLIIAFFGGVYLQPVVKPFLDHMFSH